MNDNVLVEGMILPRKGMIAEQGADVLVFSLSRITLKSVGINVGVCVLLTCCCLQLYTLR